MINFAKNRYWIILGLIIVFAFVLRVWQLGTPSMWFDETISSVAMREILEDGKIVFDSGVYYSRAHVFHYASAVFLWIFGGDFGARFFTALIGTATVLLAFFIGREFDKEKKKPYVGLIASLFVAVFFLEVLYSRQARFYQMFQFLFFLTTYLLYKVKDGEKYAWFACISLIVLIDTHIAGVVMIPFVLFMFWMNKMSWKLYILPVLLMIYKFAGVLGLGYDGGNVSGFVENYSSSLFYRLRAFAIIALIGIPFAWKSNRKMILMIMLPMLVLFGGILFLKLFAIRYVYFAIFPLIICLAVLIGWIGRHNKILMIMVVLFAIVYPSNLFFNEGNMTVVVPTAIEMKGTTTPVMNYNGLSAETMGILKENKVVVIATPGFEWYIKKPEYAIPYSLSGLGDPAMDNGLDVYTGASEFNFNEKNFVYVEDYFGYGKLNADVKARVDGMKENCNLIEKIEGLSVWRC